MKKFIFVSLTLTFSVVLMMAQKTFINTSIDLDARSGMSMVTLFATDDNNQELTELNYCFIWNTGDSSSQITIPMPLEETLYSVTITGTDGAVEVLEISSSCFLNLAVMPNITCSGQKATLMVTDPNGIPLQIGNGYNYFWSDDPNIHTPGRGVSPLTTTSYTVTVTYNPDGGPIECSTSMTRTVNVMPSPVIAWQQIPGAICSGQTLLMQVTDNAGNVLPNGGGWQYDWSTGHTVPSFTISPTSTATYSVTVTSPDGCVIEMQPRVVVVNPRPTVPYAFQRDWADGSGASLELPYIFGLTYEWSTQEFGQIAHVTSPGDYRLTVTDQNGCTNVGVVYVTPFATCEAEIIFVEVPHDTCLSGGGCTLTAEIISDDDAVFLCEGDELGLSLNVTGGTGLQLYNWNTGKVTKDITITSGGDYSVTVTDQDSCTAVASIWIDQRSGPEASNGPNGAKVKYFTICAGGNAIQGLHAIVEDLNEVAEIDWFPSGGQTTNQQQSYSYYLNIPGEYSFTAIVRGKNGCSTILYFYVTVDDCLTSTEEDKIESLSSINVYPNPALKEGAVKVSGLPYGDYRVSVQDVLGQSLKSSQMREVGESFEVSIQELSIPAGVYTLVMKNGRSGKLYARKFVVVE